MRSVCLGLPEELYRLLEEEAARRRVKVGTLIRQLLAERYSYRPKRGGRRPVVRGKVLEAGRERPWLLAALRPAAKVLGVHKNTLMTAVAALEAHVYGVHKAVYEALKRDVAAWLCQRAREWKSQTTSISLGALYKAAGAPDGARAPHLNFLLIQILTELGASKVKKVYVFKNGATCNAPQCYGDLRILRMLYTAYKKPSEETLKTLWELSIRCVDGEP